MNPTGRLQNAAAGFLKGAITGAVLAGIVVGALVFLGPVALAGLKVLAAPLVAKWTVVGTLSAFGGTVLSAGAAGLSMGGLAALVSAPIGAAVGAIAGAFKDPDTPPPALKKQDVAVSPRSHKDSPAPERSQAPERNSSPEKTQSSPEAAEAPQPEQGSAVQRYVTSRRNPSPAVATAPTR